MELPDDVLCLYTARVTENQDSYTIEVPKQEVELGGVQSGEVYRAALLPSAVEPEPAPRVRAEPQGPPLEEGDIRDVEIERLGDQGDGLVKVDRGYVVIVPGTDVGDRVTIRVTEAKENVAFAEVIKEAR
ncbi:TRAM domain-containing protein [Halobiforma nitratireducens]|uniref:TRAM domain-containing protein n=1 Tax=Halobiforma nitratireducens JCM 10879 TaxID=1227454 RepID=M0LH48_9EURY|nr:TRAM domain-containing protein [Halobiforma nitratireducens]EMA31320.1 hypothetical protein C446_15800 [Halobiforma nitratireducens JCM 10879]